MSNIFEPANRTCPKRRRLMTFAQAHGWHVAYRAANQFVLTKPDIPAIGTAALLLPTRRPATRNPRHG